MHELKKKYDKIFDDIFFSKDFKNYMIGKVGYCPNGLTIDTIVEDNHPEFYPVCKEYGYDYSGERVIGDYIILQRPNNLDILFSLMNDYLAKFNKELVDELSKY